MANEIVQFKRGDSENLPSTLTPGTVYVETDTGQMYVDDDTSTRIHIEDDTKLPITGGTLTLDSDSSFTINSSTGTNYLTISETFGGVNINAQLIVNSPQTIFNSVGIVLNTQNIQVSQAGVQITGDEETSYLKLALPTTISDALSITDTGTLTLTDTAKQNWRTALGITDSSGITQDQADARYLQLTGGTLTGNLTLSDNHVLTAPVMHGQSLAVNTIEPDTTSSLVLSGGTGNLVEIPSDLQVDNDITSTGNLTVGTTSGASTISINGLMSFGQISTSESIAPIDTSVSFNYKSSSSASWKQIFSYNNTGILMRNHKITGLAEPTVDTDAATKSYVDEQIATVSGGGGSGDFMANGSVAMTGNLNVGNNSIINYTIDDGSID